MASEDKIQLVRQYVSNMPSLPITVSKIIEVCDSAQTSPIDLDRVIKLDPVLMGRVLKLVNSAYYGFASQVTSLVKAIIMLGMNTVKNLALSCAILDNVGNKSAFRALSMEGFWRHSLCVAVLAKMLAKNRGVDTYNHEEYFAAGLLHDIGKIPLNHLFAADYIQTIADADKKKVTLFLAEQEKLQVDHCQIGSLIAGYWKITGPIADTISFHHRLSEYTGEYSDIINTVAIANQFACNKDIGFSGDRNPQYIPSETYSRLALSKTLLHDYTDGVKAEIDKAKIFLSLRK